MRIGIYKDTFANCRGADAAVLALAEGLCACGYDAVVFERLGVEKRMAELWDVVISTGTNELLDLYDCFSTCSARPIFPFPVIQQFHTNPKSQFKWKRFVRNWRIRRALRCVNAIQVLSNDFVPQVAKYGVRVSVIGNWSKYSRVERVERVEKVVIYPAAFAKGKNQKLLIKAFAVVSTEFPEWQLRLFGRDEGSYAVECRKLAVRLGVANRVDFAGFCDNLADEYSRCAFVAFPSVNEGFPLTVVEAAAFSKPCVMVNDWTGTAAAKGGIDTKPTVEAYADGLRRLMADAELRRRMGAAAQNFCAATYSRERILDKWESLLKDMLRQVE